MAGSLGPYRIVDLTKRIVPGQIDRRCELRLIKQERTQDYCCEMDLMSHLGTHVESPYHFNLDWKDIAALPASAYVGRCVILRITDIQPAGKITAAHMDRADGGRVRKGDMVLVDTPYHLPPFSFPEKEIRPYVNAEMGQWLVDKGVKCVAFADAVDIETNVPEFIEFHRVTMAHDITFIEVLENIDQLKSDVFLLIALPLPIEGLDSCPVRAVAIEGIPGLDE